LQCHQLNQHSSLTELKIIFKDSNISYRLNQTTNDNFYHYICPSICSKFEDIYTIYGPLISHYLYSQSRTDLTRLSQTNRYLFQRSPTLSEGFTHQKLFHTILLNHLHPLTYERLKILNIAHYKFFAAYHSTATRKHSLTDLSSSSVTTTTTTTNDLIPTNLRLILKFTNITSINLSHTDIRNYCLDLIIETLTKLETLDISSCRSLTSFNSLLKLSATLKYLNLYNCSFHMQLNPTIYQILFQLKTLEYLDISTDIHSPIINVDYDINKFLIEESCLKNLKYLDVSGQKTIRAQYLRTFLLSHSNLQFLGLFLTAEKYSNCLLNSTDLCYSKTRIYTYDLQEYLSTNITENDYYIFENVLIESLKRYNERANFVQKILYYIFFLTRSFQSRKQNLLIDLILSTMANHQYLQSVQMPSTACIYNLTRTPLTEQINIRTLSKIIQAILHVMEMFPNQQQLQKNCLLTLCSDRILHEPNFNFYALATLVMRNLQNYTDLPIIQPGVAVLALLTTRLTVSECTQLASVTNLQRLLQLIEQQIDRLHTMQLNSNQQINDLAQQDLNDPQINLNPMLQLTGDDTLRFCLSLLWNLTDENPIVCERFIHSMGLQLFQRLIHLFSLDTIILTKIVGLLSNISEVAHLRVYLYSIDIIPLMQKFLTDGIIDIAFSAAGILANLLLEQIDREVNVDLCQYMRNAILKWQNPDTNMITYRSFKPFLPMLNCTQIPVIQLWAVWAIHHVCSTDRARYSRIIREEKFYELIEKLYNDQLLYEHSDPCTIQLLKSTLQLLKPYRSYHCSISNNAVAS